MGGVHWRNFGDWQGVAVPLCMQGMAAPRKGSVLDLYHLKMQPFLENIDF